MIALIMAGGNGRRLWPFGEEDQSKPFLKVNGEHSMLQAAYRRALTIVKDGSRVFITTRRELVALVKDQLPFLPMKNMIVEPSVRDTGPALAFSLARLENLGCSQQEALIMLPGDNFIGQARRYCSAIRAGAHYVTNHKDKTILCGQLPTRADSSFGYMKCEGEVASWPQYALRQISGFVEKPSSAKAQELINSGNVWWSVGVYIWQMHNLRCLFEKHAPQIGSAIQNLSHMMRRCASDKEQADFFEQLPRISVDYAITEKQGNYELLSLTSDYEWIDFGSWDEWSRFFKEIMSTEKVNQYDCGGNFILSDGSVEVKLLGIRDSIIVISRGKVLMCRKGSSQVMKELA